MSQTKTNGVKIEASWKKWLEKEFDSEYFSDIKNKLKNEKEDGKIIYPPGNQIFAAFDHCSFDNVKVVIIGQDPYHGEGQANGLCFSVAPGIKKPPSLVNIFKELNRDLNIPVPENGDLSAWAKQGVLLLNAILTVRASEAGSHQNIGWEKFTNRVIEILSEEKEGLVFLLWGKFAQEKAALIDDKKHFILESVHPSPFSADKGFFGCSHFSKTNEILKSIGRKALEW